MKRLALKTRLRESRKRVMTGLGAPGTMGSVEGDCMKGMSVREAAALAREAWDDRVSRPCLVIGLISAWLTVTLVDASFLALLCASTWLVRWRHLNRPPIDLEDYF